MTTHPTLTVFDSALHQCLHGGYEVETLDTQCVFSEGPVWNPGGFYLFSDIPQNLINKLVPGTPKEVYLHPSGCTHSDRQDLHEQIGSNGLAYDPEGRLLICQHGNHALARYDGHQLTPLVEGFGGRPFNSPNDVVADAAGRVFFSDPPYGLKGQVPNPERYQPRAGVYCWQEGELWLICEHYQYPNGVCLSPDGRTLYICSTKLFENFVLEYDMASLSLRRTLARENSDGIKCDRRGNLYLATKEGVLILSAEGVRLGLITLETTPANLCWGGAEGNDLLVTARQNVYLLRGVQKP